MESQLHGLMDYHVHTSVTIDGRMTEAQACERAILMGMEEIAFTNHVMLTEPEYTISSEALLKHWERIQACQRRYPQLTIRLGLEVDYYQGREEEIAGVIERYQQQVGRPFDLVLGAVHHLKGVFFSSEDHAPELFNHHDIVALYHEYFSLATMAARSRLFDVMAHPDLIKKSVGVLSPLVPFGQYRGAAESFVDALLASNTGLEMNTKGYKHKVGEAYPSDELLALYLSKARARGIEPIITLGSDAHKVEDVGARISRGAAALQKLGLPTIMRYEKRKPSSVQMSRPRHDVAS